jgi:hypothetical protein
MPAAGYEKERLAVLLDAAKTAITRNRYVFAAINIGAILVLTAQFNGLAPWIRNTIERAKDPKIKDILIETIWRDLSTVSIPLLGLKFSSADVSVVGAIGMAVLAVWYFYATRRENHVISAIAQEAEQAINENNFDKARYLYDGVAHYFVFTTVTDYDAPGGQDRRVMARAAVRALTFAPFWVPLAAVLFDITSLFFLRKINLDPGEYLWDKLGTDEKREVFIRLIIAIGFSFFSLNQCRDCERFDTSTRTLLDRLRARVEPVVPVPPPSPRRSRQ